MVPPLALVAGAGLAQRVMTRPARKLGAVPRVLAVATGGASAAFALSSVREFRRGQTTVNPMSPDQATALVTGGPHRISRNPMYVGMAGALAAQAVLRGRWMGVLPVVAFVAVIDRVQIPAEEAALTENFGATYATYAAEVPRWLRLPMR